MRQPDQRLPARLAIAACALFWLAGQAFIPLLGVQNDEALFGYAFLQPRSGYTVPLGHSHLPLMLMSYLGTLKAWLYRPVFAVFHPGVWSLREPALLFGAASLWVFFLLLRRIAGARAALIGCALLSVDSMYLLTVCFDWGPVALQHLLLVGGMLLLVRFHQRGGALALASGFFLFGLAMWDKALAIWMLSGMGVAALALFPRQIWRAATPARAVVAVASFALGALPLIVYNANNHFATFQGQSYTTAEIAGKARLLLDTARGDAMFGWLVNDDWQTPAPHPPAGALQKASAAISGLAGGPRQNLLPYAFALALLLAPLARGHRRAILFALIVMAVQWAQMAITVNAGGSVHHTILLWPLPEMVIAISFGSASRRLGRAAIPVTACVLAVTVAAGALQINEYYRLAWRDGGAQNWTDAVYPLADYMKTARAQAVYCVDWGILDSLRVLDRGKLPLDGIYDAVPADGAPDLGRIRSAAASPDHLFIAHTKAFEFFEGRNAKLVQAAESEGYRRDMLAVIPDSFGRPTYEVYRFVGLYSR